MAENGTKEKVNKEIVKKLFVDRKLLFSGIFSSSYYEVEEDKLILSTKRFTIIEYLKAGFNPF